MPTPTHPLRNHILTLFRRGELASASEAAMIAGVTKQAVARWIKDEGLDIEACRLRLVAKLRARLQDVMDAEPIRRPSKANMRRQAEKAVREFNRANGAKRISRQARSPR